MSNDKKIKRLRGEDGRFIKLAEASHGSPQSGEIAVSQTSLGGLSMLAYNPDTLAKSKGGLSIYRTMVADSHVKASLQQKKAALLSVPWDILPASSEPLDVEVAKFVKWNLSEYLIDSFETDLIEFLYALDDGFSLSEMVWATVEDGPWAGKWAYESFKSKDPVGYNFEVDKYGNVLPKGLINNSATNDKEKYLPTDKFFIYAYTARYRNPYGQSDLRAAYRAFWIKDTAWKLRAIYMERFSGNFLKGKYKPSDKVGREKLLKIFKSWSQQTGVALPEGIDIEVINMATSSDSEYRSSIADCNKEIIIGILGASLTVDEGSKGNGAKALGTVHKDVADLFVLFMDISLSSEINKQVVRQLVDFNFTGVTSYPKFAFESRAKITANDIKTLKDAGIDVPDEWVYRKLRITPPTEAVQSKTALYKYHIDAGSVSRNEIRARLGLDPITGEYFDKPIDPASLSPQVEGAFGEVISMYSSGVLRFQDPVKINPSLVAIGVLSSAEAGAIKPSGTIESFQDPAAVVRVRNLPDKEELEPGNFWRAPNEFEKFAEIEVVDETTRATEESAISGSQSIYGDIEKDILSQVKKKGILDLPESKRAQAIEEAAKIVVNVGPLRDQLFNAILVDDQLGRVQQMTEINNQDPTFKFREAIKFAETPLNVEILSTATPPKHVVDIMAKRTPMTRDAFESMVEVRQADAFYVAGLEKMNIEKDVQPLTVQAINEGWDLREYEFRLSQTFVKYKEPVFNQVGTQGEKVLDYHVQTVFRNAMMTSYNQARDDMRSDPDVIEAFPANFYSAIMDNRTSDICRALDGSVFMANDPAWNKYKPQNHHNCRSILITINKFDFTPSMLSPLPEVVIPAGFGGQ